MRQVIGVLFAVALYSPHALGADCSESKAVVDGTYDINTDVPNYLQGATIVVILKDGRQSTVPAERFKVVPRKQQFITKQTTKVVSCSAEEAKNRISLLGGVGTQEGIKVSKPTATTLEAESNTGFVGGVQYQRRVGRGFSLGVQLQTNKTGSGMLGVDF